MTDTCYFCKKEYVKRTLTRKFCSLLCANRCNLNRLQTIQYPENSEQFAEFIGICLGDGCAGSYQTSITLNSIADRDYIPYVVSLCEQLFSLVPKIVKKKNENAIEIRINSKRVGIFLRKMGIISYMKTIPSWILAERKYRRRCVRGLFDTEGSISFKRYKNKRGISLYKQLNFRNTDIKLMTLVRDTLLEAGVAPTVTLKKSLYISNNNAIDRVRKIIGFSNPKLLLKSSINTIEEYEDWQEHNLTQFI